MLGTGNATVTQIYNTCFVLATDTYTAGESDVYLSCKAVGFLMLAAALPDHFISINFCIRLCRKQRFFL